MFTNLYLKATLKKIINKSRPLISVIFDDPDSELSAACTQLSTLVRAHAVIGQGRGVFEALIDALHVKLRKGIFSCFFNKKILAMIDPPASYLLSGRLNFDEHVKINIIVLPTNFKVSSSATWFNKHKTFMADDCKIICYDGSDMAKYLEKRNYYGLVTYGNEKTATVSFEDASQYDNGFRWKLITDGKTLPMSLNGVNSEKQVLDWLAAIALVKTAGTSLTSIISQFQTEIR